MELEYLPSAPCCATNVLFDVRKTTLWAPYLSFLTVTWELHFLFRKWWEDKSVKDCEMLKCCDVEMNVRQICKQKASEIPFHGFYSVPWQTRIPFVTPGADTQGLIFGWALNSCGSLRSRLQHDSNRISLQTQRSTKRCQCLYLKNSQRRF